MLAMLCLEVAAYGVAGGALEWYRSLVARQFNAAVSAGQEVDKVPYADMINRIARREGVSARLVASVIQAESSFQPEVLSPTGAAGLMQILPSTWEEVNSRIRVCVNRHSGECSQECYFNPEMNISIGTDYLSQMVKRYHGNTFLALAAYTAGPGTVDRCKGAPFDAATEEYVSRVMANWYHFAAEPLPDSSIMVRWCDHARRVLGWIMVGNFCLTVWATRRMRRRSRSWRWR